MIVRNMRNYLLALLGAFTLLVSFSSCTDQKEIDIIYNQEATLEVNLLNMYETCGIDFSKFQTQFVSGYRPTVLTLVYDTEGTYQYSIKSILYNFNNPSIPLIDLDRKEYIVIVVQYLMEYDNESQTGNDFWSLYNVKDFDKVSILSKEYQIPWYCCLGIDVQKIDLKSGKNFKSTPKLAGSFVSLDYENLYNGGYNRVALYFKNKVTGLYLNPNREGLAKYFYDNYNDSNSWTAVAKLERPEVLYIKDDDNFFILESGRINCCIGLSTKDDGTFFTAYPSTDSYFDFELGKNYTAYCEYNGETDKVTTYLGTSIDFEKWYEKFDKWIPNTFDDPFTKWGASVEEVKKYMTNKKYTLWYDLTPMQSMDGDTYYYLGYYGRFVEDDIQYEFENKTGNLLTAFEIIYNNDMSINQIIDHFDKDPKYKRYEPFEETFYEYGCYFFYDEFTQVEIYPNFEDDYGLYTQIAYSRSTVVEDETRGRKQIKSNLSFVNKRANSNIMTTIKDKR